mmetsp:Transcript_39974/g.55735  ORF Transcript_39974/g.55735 Transcript_39974/m.55735 type:complete len:325 (-) Transcript_39974:344-1318(-)
MVHWLQRLARFLLLQNLALLGAALHSLLVTNALATLLQRARQLELHDSGDRCKFLLVFSSADLLEAHAQVELKECTFSSQKVLRVDWRRCFDAEVVRNEGIELRGMSLDLSLLDRPQRGSFRNLGQNGLEFVKDSVSLLDSCLGQLTQRLAVLNIVLRRLGLLFLGLRLLLLQCLVCHIDAAKLSGLLHKLRGLVAVSVSSFVEIELAELPDGCCLVGMELLKLRATLADTYATPLPPDPVAAATRVLVRLQHIKLVEGVGARGHVRETQGLAVHAILRPVDQHVSSIDQLSNVCVHCDAFLFNSLSRARFFDGFEHAGCFTPK